jgi:hypothetical protein
VRIEVKDGEAVAKEALWLAWLACGGPLGMGVFRDKPDAGREDVWKNAIEAGDYPAKLHDDKSGTLYADYVFGRMMKLRLGWGPGWVSFDDRPPQIDYQGWVGAYPTNESLIRAAIASVNSGGGDVSQGAKSGRVSSSTRGRG